MNAPLPTLFRFNLGYLESLLAGVSDADFTHQPAPEVKPPTWIVGHLAQVHDSGRWLLGEERRLPAEYKDWFGVGSDAAGGPFPPKDELLANFREVSKSLLAIVEATDLSGLTEPNPFAGLAKVLPTKGDLLSHMLTTHFATHLGQLSTWRRMMGHPPLV